MREDAGTFGKPMDKMFSSFKRRTGGQALRMNYKLSSAKGQNGLQFCFLGVFPALLQQGYLLYKQIFFVLSLFLSFFLSCLMSILFCKTGTFLCHFQPGRSIFLVSSPTPLPNTFSLILNSLFVIQFTFFQQRFQESALDNKIRRYH